jgi:hypothetical protein
MKLGYDTNVTLNPLYFPNCTFLNKNKHTTNIITFENKGVYHVQTLKFYKHKTNKPWNPKSNFPYYSNGE